MTKEIDRLRIALEFAINVGASAVPINPDVLASVLTHIDDQAAEIDRIKAQQERNPMSTDDIYTLLRSGVLNDGFTAVVRAIEAHHGIKETP